MGVSTLVALENGAHACSIEPPVHHVLDADEVSLDSEPPGIVSVISAELHRGDIGGESGNCSSLGWFDVRIDPSGDNRTEDSELGYAFSSPNDFDGLRFQILESNNIEDGVFRGLGGRRLMFFWNDDNPRESIDFSFTIAAVDLAGNVGPPSEPVQVSDSGVFWCSCHVSAGSNGMAGTLLLVVMLPLLRRRSPSRSR